MSANSAAHLVINSSANKYTVLATEDDRSAQSKRQEKKSETPRMETKTLSKKTKPSKEAKPEKATRSIEEKEEAPQKAKGFGKTQFGIRVVIETLDDRRRLETDALIDTGCDNTSIDADWIKQEGLNTVPMNYPIEVLNADGSKNAHGKISRLFSSVL